LGHSFGSYYGDVISLTLRGKSNPNCKCPTCGQMIKDTIFIYFDNSDALPPYSKQSNALHCWGKINSDNSIRISRRVLDDIR